MAGGTGTITMVGTGTTTICTSQVISLTIMGGPWGLT